MEGLSKEETTEVQPTPRWEMHKMISPISGPKLLRSAFNEVDHLETLDPYSSAVSGHQGSNEQKKRNFTVGVCILRHYQEKKR